VEMTQGRKAYLRAAYPALAFNSEAPTHINTCQHQLAIHAHTRARARARSLSRNTHTKRQSCVSSFRCPRHGLLDRAGAWCVGKDALLSRAPQLPFSARIVVMNHNEKVTPG